MASWDRTRSLLCRRTCRSPAAAAFARFSSSLARKAKEGPPLRQALATAAIAEGENEDVPTSGISRPLSEILKELNKKIPEALVSARHEGDVSLKYVPWHFLNRILNVHAPEWSGEIRSIVYSADGSSVTVVYRITPDADRLDAIGAIGAIGIARCFVYGGSKNHVMYDPEIPPREFLTKEKYIMKDAKTTTINHFHEKLFKLKDLMKTKAGKRRAERRHKFMEDFLQEFHMEWDGRA